MNRFRTKKRAKDDSSTGPSFKGFRKGKKSAEEPKVELDLTTALPSNDNFRTSLLMTNLSARFSMLREQDDPKTKIGKASDDSVLYPRRQSRLADFGFGGGLSDIAEVESIKAPPSFARLDTNSSDDADSLRSGSIMDRAKPIEGNNLFGGRQKIYKIPVGSSSSKNLASGGMGGRVVYGDDVAMSSFQLWRQAEKQIQALEDEENLHTSYNFDDEAEPNRSESPVPLDYNQRRETSSTTSSALARNSTAATSFTSQPPASVKDWHSTSTGISSSTSTPALDRSVTRTRRLYEQGLTQDLHEHQSSALSRMDTLARQRIVGNRTPDVSQNSPSPTAMGFGDKFGGERRPILSKASAPNLRSISPPATASSTSTMDLGIRVPVFSDAKAPLGGMPPLSPPISETGDHPVLPIQPNDRGKATAMGVFSKPNQPYDESKFAQRQLQLQQGRDTPTHRVRTDSDASSYTTDRSRSSSSPRRQLQAAKHDAASRSNPTLSQEPDTPTFLFDDIDDEAHIMSSNPSAAPSLPVQRPSDRDHPAFRQPTMPSPLSMTSRASEDPSPIQTSHLSTSDPNQSSLPADSPTLGPGSGLSGLVRQHLRSESNTSSNYGSGPQNGDLGNRASFHLRNSSLGGYGATSDSWIPQEQDWTLSYYGEDHASVLDVSAPSLEDKEELAVSKNRNASDAAMGNETDEFASQLANARRRVRERLTSYVESDNSRAPSPQPVPEFPKDLASQKSSGTLRSKSSRGSLVERSRSLVGNQSKAMKMLGIGLSTISSSTQPPKATEENQADAMPNMMEDQSRSDVAEDSGSVAVESDRTPKAPKDNADENMHPGVRAFRQARRELRRHKESETLVRHQGASAASHSGSPQSDGQPSPSQSTLARERGPSQSSPSRERRPPPVTYQQRIPSDDSGPGGTNSHPSSRQSSTDRNRSGSESGNERSGTRPARLRNNSAPYENQQGQLDSSSLTRQGMLRSPGLPGTDIRRSPIMPPPRYGGSGSGTNTPTNAPSPNYFQRSRTTANLNLQPSWAGYESGSSQPSPMTPLNGLPSSPYPMSNSSAISTPTTLGPSKSAAPHSPAFGATTSTLDDSMKRHVNKSDISEPSFIMSTSRVPTVNLPYSASSPEMADLRSRSGSNGDRSAPPLPPINPRRKRDDSTSRTRGVLDNLMGRKDSRDVISASSSTPHLPIVNRPSASPVNGMSASGGSRVGLSASDDEDTARSEQRRPIQKNNVENHATSNVGRFGRARGASPPFVATGPPASRAVLTPGMTSSSSAVGMAGGMI